jgi:hypothetical protein
MNGAERRRLEEADEKLLARGSIQNNATTPSCGRHRSVRITEFDISMIIRLSPSACAKFHSCVISDSAAATRLAACGSLHFNPIRLSRLKRVLPI